MCLKIKIDDPRLLEPGNQIGYGSEGAAGIDLRACGYLDKGEIKRINHDVVLYPGDELMVSAGFSMALPYGKAAMLLPRSGLGSKGIVFGNLVGLVDSDYRGLVSLSIWYRKEAGNAEPFAIEPMMRIAQMMIVPAYRPAIEYVSQLPQTVRGAGSFGSTGVS